MHLKFNSIQFHVCFFRFFHYRQTGSKPHNIAGTTACIWPAFHHRKRTIDWRSTYVTLVSWRRSWKNDFAGKTD